MLNENFPGLRELSLNLAGNDRSWNTNAENMVLPHTVNEMRTRRLIKIGHPASKEREMAADKVHRSSAREGFR
jgi:hypothetical protein